MFQRGSPTDEIALVGSKKAVHVSIEQRPILMPVDGWSEGQRARNVATPWKRVGVAQGTPGELAFLWRDPCWE